jgi:hypothetical protein
VITLLPAFRPQFVTPITVREWQSASTALDSRTDSYGCSGNTSEADNDESPEPIVIV